MLKRLCLTLLVTGSVLATAMTPAVVFGKFNSCSVADNGGSSGYVAHIDVTEYDPIVAYVDVTLTDANLVVGGGSFTIAPSNNNTLLNFAAGGVTNLIAPGFGVTWGDIGRGSCAIGYGTLP